MPYKRFAASCSAVQGTRQPNTNNKDRMFLCICNAKMIVFREAAFIANGLLSARITIRCGYKLCATHRFIGG